MCENNGQQIESEQFEHVSKTGVVGIPEFQAANKGGGGWYFFQAL